MICENGVFKAPENASKLNKYCRAARNRHEENPLLRDVPLKAQRKVRNFASFRAQQRLESLEFSKCDARKERNIDSILGADSKDRKVERAVIK